MIIYLTNYQPNGQWSIKVRDFAKYMLLVNHQKGIQKYFFYYIEIYYIYMYNVYCLYTLYVVL